METEIKKIVDEAAMRGHDVKIRDVSYALLCARFKDSKIAYTVVFGAPSKEEDIDIYESMDSIKYLIRWFKKDLAPKENGIKNNADILKEIKSQSKKQDVSDSDDNGVITFAENRAGIEAQIDEIIELKKQLINEDGQCTDVKTMAILQKTEADLRSKLNDKFGAADKTNEQYIIVQPKFNHICEHTHKECWLMTEEWAKQHYHLIKDPNWADG